MESTRAFQMHKIISTNALSQLTQAVSLDEQNLKSEAFAAYTQASSLLKAYIGAFAPTAAGFIKLSNDEQHTVENMRTTLARHLRSVQNRVQSMTNPQPNPTATKAVKPYVPHGPAYPPPSRVPGPGNTKDPLRQAIESEIVDNSPKVSWDDIHGLEEAKRALNEMVVLPAQRPDLYTGLRAPGRGVLLFGPPGTGKTMIAKAVASNAHATFFSISASSLNSKFHGESERLVRALFAVAKERQPSFIFIDEVDSILGVRSDSEHEASRRLKTEFMSQFDGVGGADDRVYVMAASNRPQDLDDAVRRRLDRRIYVGLPDREGRKQFLKKVTRTNKEVRWNLADADFTELAYRTANFSGSDIKALCREASLMPLRELGHRVSDISASEVRACDFSDFEDALQIVRASSDAKTIGELEEWNEKYGSKRRQSCVAERMPGNHGSSNRKERSSSKPRQTSRDVTASPNSSVANHRLRSLRRKPKP